MADELILIIEDNEKNRKLVRDVLQGYRTVESETAEEGLKLVAGKSPDLILMDIQLPGMDGITALKQLRADAKTKPIPVIAITASAMTHNRATMLAEGFDGYQTKPLSIRDFLEEVRRVLDARGKP
ncbi:MAG: response regulator [Deltaproteobacteria bacterium]|nr:response regulator [Deltaproteobacteria bacterium]